MGSVSECPESTEVLSRFSVPKLASQDSFFVTTVCRAASWTRHRISTVLALAPFPPFAQQVASCRLAQSGRIS